MNKVSMARFADLVESKCDNAAAVGNANALSAYEQKCLRALYNTKDSSSEKDDILIVIAHATNAVSWRANAIRHRLSGNIAAASLNEQYSEEAIGCIRDRC